MKRKVSLFSMSLLYVLAGINHFINTGFYITIMPAYIPFHNELVLMSGVLEIIFGLLLLPQKTRAVSSWCIVFMLIAFLPVHVQMVIDNTNPGKSLFWIAWFRLPLQYILIRWAYKMRKVKLIHSK